MPAASSGLRQWLGRWLLGVCLLHSSVCVCLEELHVDLVGLSHICLVHQGVMSHQGLRCCGEGHLELARLVLAGMVAAGDTEGATVCVSGQQPEQEEQQQQR